MLKDYIINTATVIVIQGPNHYSDHEIVTFPAFQLLFAIATSSKTPQKAIS